MRTEVGGYAHIVPPVSPYIPPIFPTSSDRTYKFIPIVDRRLLPIMKHEADPAAEGQGALISDQDAAYRRPHRRRRCGGRGRRLLLGLDLSLVDRAAVSHGRPPPARPTDIDPLHWAAVVGR